MFPFGYNSLKHSSQMWWNLTVILTLWRLRREDYKFQASLSYMGSPFSKNQKQQQNTLVVCVHKDGIPRGEGLLTQCISSL
jgi:hypothetical protein